MYAQMAVQWADASGDFISQNVFINYFRNSTPPQNSQFITITNLDIKLTLLLGS
jgi:hypothetical protein